MLIQPVFGVTPDFLKFEKMKDKIPAVVMKPGTKDVQMFYMSSRWPADNYPDVFYNGPVMVDCDGDAVFIPGQYGAQMADFPNGVDKGDIGQLAWDKTGIEADGQQLMTTVVIDENSRPLGVAYSSRQSGIENYRAKIISGLGEKCAQPYRVATFRSRTRGIWAKGLKRLDDSKFRVNPASDDPLPENLKLSPSGNFLRFDGMYANREGDALLMKVTVPKGHNFCHQRYEAFLEYSRIYEDDEMIDDRLPRYRSCFHRVLVPESCVVRLD